MDFYDKVELRFEYIPTDLIHLNESEWKKMIKIFCDKLKNKFIGSLLINKLMEFLLKGYNIIISNNDYSVSQVIYPKIRLINRTTVLIVIPSVPYFTLIDTVSKDLCSNIDELFIKNMDNILKGMESKFKINFYYDYNDYTFLLSKTKSSNFINFAHELIHVLRFFEGYRNDDFEEDATIYGLEGYTLKYIVNDSQYVITENIIRLENEMELRVSHESQEMLCHDLRHSYKNAYKYDKSDFFI